VTDLPIIFSAPMVKALLEGRKTMTRRLAWGRPFPVPEEAAAGWRSDGCRVSFADDTETCACWRPSAWQRVQPGDRLWVRESWRPGAWRYDEPGGRIAADYMATPELNRTPWLSVPGADWRKLWPKMCAEAEAAVTAGRGSTRRSPDTDDWTWDRGDSPCAWRPSIHMPRWASRLTLTVTAVRVERLRAISREDAMAEGIEDLSAPDHVDFGIPGIVNAQHPVRAFWLLWNSLHGPDAWDANPEVVALAFTVERRNIDGR